MATLIVKKSIMHRYQSINQALQDAEVGDSIEIRDGVYEESIEISKRLTLYGRGDVTISGAVFIRYHTHVEMRNLRFSKGQGIYIKGDLQLENCIIEQQMVHTQVTVKFGTLMMKNVDLMAGPANQFGIRIDNGSSVMLEETTIQHHTKAQIIIQNSHISLSKCMLLEGRMNGIFAIRNVEMTIADCELHGHEKAQIVAALSTISLVNTIIHEGQDLGVQILNDSKLTMDQCTIKQHAGTNIVVHESEIIATDSTIASSQMNGVYVGEKSKAVIYDCQLLDHSKPQLFIENSKAEIRKCHIKKGATSGVTLFNEADVHMTECHIHHHTQFQIIADASGLVLEQCTIQFGETGGIYGNDHAKITIKNSQIQHIKSHQIYITNARLFANNCTFHHVVGNGITCIDAIVEVKDSNFSHCPQSPYSIFWSDKSMGRIQNCEVAETERTFLAMTNRSLLEIIHNRFADVKTVAIVQDHSQLYIRGIVKAGNWQKDASSRIIQLDLQPTTKEKIQQMVDTITTQADGRNKK
ncbi:right-handed parallel beta-helix repeat-containing protein [Lysinibacillus sp. NPDC097195]|uniref:right-handed parallel beta-helix repeat-containing protein n=1 Tax=Lysinibacillus sp. NPDC097195 TaxID=3364141 RepID=UPI003807DEBF